MSTYTVDGKREYQKIYVRIARTTEDLKHTISGTLQEIFKLKFEILKFAKDSAWSNQNKMPVPVDASYELKAAKEKVVQGVIYPQIDGVRSAVVAVETLAVSVPESNKLDSLVPFYRDVTLEFFGKYKNNVAFSDLEALAKGYQSYPFEELKSEKLRLEVEREEWIYTRILQETFKAYHHIEESLNLSFDTGRHEKLQPYLETSEKTTAFVGLTMLKLKKEGFGYLESVLAVNKFVLPYSHIEDQNSETTPTRETTLVGSYNIEELETWRSGENVENAVKELNYIKHRKAEILQEQEHKKWQRQTREDLIKAIQRGDLRPTVYYNYARCNCMTKESLDEVMKIHDQLIQEGYCMKLKLKPVKIGGSVTIESVGDSSS